MKDIETYNDKLEPHGYWERYSDNGNLKYKGNYINGRKDGYWELYYYDGKFHHGGIFINGKEKGYWEYYWFDGNIYSKEYYI